MIWLIGYKGMLGSEIARQLSENKIDFFGTDIDVDITSYEALSEFASNKSIKWIINCAAYTAVDLAESNEELCGKLNAVAPGNIAKVAKEVGATVIHISTDYVFDGTGDTPRTEDMTIAPIGVYGKTKADGEKAVADNTDKFYILRTAWLYGWAGKNFVYTMLRAMNKNPAVKVVADQKGTPTFAGDLAGVIIQLINAEKPIEHGVYHVTDLGEISWWDFTKEIKAQGIKTGWITDFGKNCVVNPCSTDEYPTPAKRPAYSVLSKDKIQKALNIKLPDWKESLTVFLESPLFDKSRLL